MVKSIANFGPPASALTKMGVSPVNALQKNDITIGEQNQSFAYTPQVRKPAVTEIPKPSLSQSNAPKVNIET